MDLLRVEKILLTGDGLVHIIITLNVKVITPSILLRVNIKTLFFFVLNFSLNFLVFVLN